MSDSNGLQVTPAAQWQRKTEIIGLPSGKVAEVQPLSMMSLILGDTAGDVPDMITAQVIAQFAGKETPSQLEINKSELPRMGAFIKRIVVASMVNPRIVENPDYNNGEIAYDDVSDEDREFLMGRAMPARELATAERFRPGPDAIVESGSNGGKVRATPKSAVGAGK